MLPLVSCADVTATRPLRVSSCAPIGMLAAPLSATNPFGGVTAARGPVPGGYLMKTLPETTRASNVLPGTGGSEPSEVSWSSGMPSLSRSPEPCWLLEPPPAAPPARPPPPRAER